MAQQRNTSKKPDAGRSQTTPKVSESGHKRNHQGRPKVFISHCVDDMKFVFDVYDLLIPYLGRESMYLFEKRPSLDKPFLRQVDEAMAESELILIFVGKRFDAIMEYEARRASTLKALVCIIDIRGRKSGAEMPDAIRDHLSGYHHLKDNYTDHVPPDTLRCAKDILEALKGHPSFKGRAVWNEKFWRHGLPAAPVFNYEKDVIRFYVAKQCYELINEGKMEADALGAKYQSALKAWSRQKIRETLEKGIPADWPSVHRYEPKAKNPLHAVFRSEQEESLVRAAALVGLDTPASDKPLGFPEAGPRPMLALPSRRQLRVAIVVAGGIAPGINAVIDAIVQRHDAYYRAAGQNYELEILGLKNGLIAIDMHGPDIVAHSRRLTPATTVEHATRGGSMIGTSRDAQLLDSHPGRRAERISEIATELLRQDIDVLYLIGGDGSMQAAHVLWNKVTAARNDPSRTPMTVVAVPKTMDNDILWVWQSFGFLSAVEEAREIVERLHTEVRSNPRLGIVQFFGSGSGFVVSHAVLAAATGHTALALIPEMDFSVIGVARYLKQRLWAAAHPNNYDINDPAVPIDPRIPHGLIVMAETAIPLDALECLGLEAPPAEFAHFYEAVRARVQPTDDEQRAIRTFFENGRRVQGQTSDFLRSLGIKILHEALPVLIKDTKLNELIAEDDRPGCVEPDWERLRMVRNEPRYLVRALEPSTSDIINGQRLGLLAVDAAMAGYTDCMISQWLTEFTIVPLDLVVLGRKRIPPTGMFWNSVTAKTRQPADLVSPFTARRPRAE